MSDSEKVIKGLRQHCDGSMFDRCGECSYYEIDDKPFECRDALLKDAFALLRVQEPRVLTYEETDAIAHQTEETAIYLERKSDKSLYAAIAGDTQGRVPNISWLGEKRNYLSEYGKTWRCWSSRPTDEQREAVQWQE